MAVGLAEPENLIPVRGIRLGVAQAGVRYQGRDDLALMEIRDRASCAALFTRNAFCAAPVTVSREHLAVAAPRYLLINSGNANAGTGEQGLEGARSCCRAVAAQTGCVTSRVLPFSTGVIGETLPVTRITTAVPKAIDNLAEDGWLAAARAIMTTDTVAKGCSRQVSTSDGTITVTGIAKGAGMIRPDMATMLAFIATDVVANHALLQECLEQAVNRSFNRITVDGDTSTNDACVLIATGAHGGIHIDSPRGEAFQSLQRALDEVCLFLAQAMIRDGEGATRFVAVKVRQGASEAECLEVAYTIAHSPLVKTALFAGDPNWGRIMAAVGRASLANLEIGKIRISLDNLCIVEGGERATDYTEEQGQAVMGRSEITISVDLGRGEHEATVWTSDLSYDYVKINAEYRT
ncbi:MAG: bifunctional glutamate N-acetyltransferase/amino-acid acetyltransferase ArgJ [Gammaproteobacteria bacterium]|nr:bifunctional glutamate N-acetyltransferase/amino-acid acetyltransferase ArgJ [Gammaproteobacteria bacterium]